MADWPEYQQVAILICGKSLLPSTSVYIIIDHPVTHVTQHPYLGVMFDSTMPFSPHNNDIVSNLKL